MVLSGYTGAICGNVQKRQTPGQGGGRGVAGRSRPAAAEGASLVVTSTLSQTSAAGAQPWRRVPCTARELQLREASVDKDDSRAHTTACRRDSPRHSRQPTASPVPSSRHAALATLATVDSPSSK